MVLSGPVGRGLSLEVGEASEITAVHQRSFLLDLILRSL
jgi:hypothetical protein